MYTMHEHQNTLLQEIALGLNIIPQQIDRSISFVRNGGDSLSAISVASSCRTKCLPVTVAMLMGSQSVDSVIHELDKATDGTICCSSDTLGPRHEPPGSTGRQYPIPIRTTSHGDDRVSLATETQISLMHGSVAQLGRNIIRYCETYRADDVPQVKRAWIALVDTAHLSHCVGEI